MLSDLKFAVYRTLLSCDGIPGWLGERWRDPRRLTRFMQTPEGMMPTGLELQLAPPAEGATEEVGVVTTALLDWTHMVDHPKGVFKAQADLFMPRLPPCSACCLGWAMLICCFVDV